MKKYLEGMVERIIFNVHGIVVLASARANTDLYDTWVSTYTKLFDLGM